MEEKGGLACCGRLSQCVLVFINVILLLLGAGFIVLGCLLRFWDKLVISYIDGLLTEVQIEALGADMSSVTKALSIVMIAVGGVVFLVAFMGIIGGCCRLRFFLVVYSIILMLLVIAEIVAIILTVVMKSDIDRELKTALKKTLNDSYTGDKGTDSTTKAWNYVFFTFECCGVDNYKDLHGLSKWNRQSKLGKPYQTPLHCCHDVTGEYPKVCLPSGDDVYCALEPMRNNSYFEKGCYDAVVNWLTTYGIIEIVIAACFIVIEILCIILACCLCREIGNVGKKYEDSSSEKDNDMTRM